MNKIDKTKIRNINKINIKYIIRDDKKKEYTGLVKSDNGKIYGIHFLRLNPDIILNNSVDYIQDDTRYCIYITSIKEININDFYNYKNIFDICKQTKFVEKYDFYMEEIIFGLTFEQYNEKKER